MSGSSTEQTLNDDHQKLQNEVARLEKERKDNQIKWAKEKALLEQKCEFISLEVKELQTKLKQSEEYCRLIVQFTDEGKGGQQISAQRTIPGNQDELEQNYKKQLKSKDEIINQQKDHYESQIEDLQKRITILMQNDINLKQNIATTVNTTQTIEQLSEQLKSKEAALERFKQDYFIEKNKVCQEFERQIDGLNIQQKQELYDAEMKYQKLLDSFKLTEDERMKQLENAREKERRKMKQTELESKQTEEDLRLELQSVMTMKCQLEDTFHNKERNLLNQLNQSQQKVKVLEQLNESRLEELRQCSKEKEIQLQRQLSNSEQLVEELKGTIITREQRISELDKKYHELAIQLTINSQETIATTEQTYQEKSLMDKLKREQLKEIEIKNERIQYLQSEIGNLKANVESLKAQGIQKDTVYHQEIIQERHKYSILKEKLEREQVEILQQQENVVQELKRNLNKEISVIKNTNQKLEKSSKDIESKLQGEIAALQVECHTQREQINKQYEQMMQMGIKENSSSATNQTLNSSLQNVQTQLDMANKQRIAMQGQCQQMQEQLVQMQQSANTQKVLAEQKIQFLEAQKDRAKKDLVDAQMKFQQVLLKLQEVRKNEKKDQQESSKALIDALERRYEQKIIDLKAEYSSNLAFHQSSISSIGNNSNSKYNQSADSHSILPQIVKATLSVSNTNTKQSPSLSSIESSHFHEGEVLKDNQNAMNNDNSNTQQQSYEKYQQKQIFSSNIPLYNQQSTPGISSAFMKIIDSQGSSSMQQQQSQNSPLNLTLQEQSQYTSNNYSPLKLNTPSNTGNSIQQQQQFFESSTKAASNSNNNNNNTNNKPNGYQIDSPFTPAFNGISQQQFSSSTKDFYSTSNIDKIVSEALGRAKAIASAHYWQGSQASNITDQPKNISYRG